MGFSIETSVSAVTVFLQGALSFFSPCVLPLVPLYVSYLAGGAAVVGEDGVRRYPRGKIFLNTLFRGGHQLRLLPAGAGPHRPGGVLPQLPSVVRPGQRRHHPAVRPVPAGAGQADHAAGAGTPPPLPSEQTGYEPGGGPGDGLHLQLRLDALRGPHPQQRPADGLLRGVLRCGISSDRRVHPGLRTALPGSGTLHRHGAGFLQVPPAPPAASPQIWLPAPARCRKSPPGTAAKRRPPPAILRRSTAGRTARRSPWSPLRTSL